MEVRPYRSIKRKKTKKIQVGNVSVGGDSTITVQSMTNTLTTNIKETINDTEYTWSVLFNDNLYPKNNLVVVVDNPNHIISYSDMFMGNINDAEVCIEYKQDKLIETFN